MKGATISTTFMKTIPCGVNLPEELSVAGRLAKVQIVEVTKDEKTCTVAHYEGTYWRDWDEDRDGAKPNKGRGRPKKDDPNNVKKCKWVIEVYVLTRDDSGDSLSIHVTVNDELVREQHCSARDFWTSLYKEAIRLSDDADTDLTYSWGRRSEE